MIDLGKVVSKTNTIKDNPYPTWQKVAQAVIFGFLFGFLLQKGGVGKFHILIGQLVLQDWTVVKVMLTAIIVGMVGIFTLHYFAKVNLHLKPTNLGTNIVGGLIFGAGFAFLGYCPGTAAVALGEGSWDALFGMIGLCCGSYLYAETSTFLKNTVGKYGNIGKIQLYDLTPLSKPAFLGGFILLLTATLYTVEILSRR